MKSSMARPRSSSAVLMCAIVEVSLCAQPQHRRRVALRAGLSGIAPDGNTMRLPRSSAMAISRSINWPKQKALVGATIISGAAPSAIGPHCSTAARPAASTMRSDVGKLGRRGEQPRVARDICAVAMRVAHRDAGNLDGGLALRQQRRDARIDRAPADENDAQVFGHY
jgi:hypothetical protein